MGFGNLKTPAGLQALNDFLADRSYIEGYVPSQADIVVYDAVGKAPAANLHHALRWYNNITSYQSQKSSLPGVKKSIDSYGPSGKAAAAAAADNDDDDDDFDMFGSDEEDAEAEAERKQRLAAYAAKKAKKPAVIAKSSIILDVKPWDDTTDMKEIERLVRTIEQDGLVWGQAKLVPVGYGINKLQINCVVEDLKVSVDDLEEKIGEFEDYVQSVDVAAFNKV